MKFILLINVKMPTNVGILTCWHFNIYQQDKLFCFIWFFTYHQQSFSYKGMGLPGLNKYQARINVLAQGHNMVTRVRLEPTAHLSRVKHSPTEPLRSHQQDKYIIWEFKQIKYLYIQHLVLITWNFMLSWVEHDFFKNNLEACSYLVIKCVSLCDFIPCFDVNFFPQRSQVNGFSPVCWNSCRRSQDGASNLLKQKRHRYCFFSLVTWLVLVSVNRK